jgi:hypothetical protein
MKNPLVRIIILAIIYISVTRMGHGFLTAMFITFMLVLGFKILTWGFRIFDRRKA